MDFLEYVQQLAIEAQEVGPDKTGEAISLAKAIIEESAKNGYGSVYLCLNTLKSIEGRAETEAYNYSSEFVLDNLKVLLAG